MPPSHETAKGGGNRTSYPKAQIEAKHEETFVSRIYDSPDLHSRLVPPQIARTSTTPCVC